MRKVIPSIALSLFLIPLFLPLRAGSGLVLRKILAGNITPKSIVHSGKGYFFAQNMMYRHSIAVYDRDYQLVKTLSDKVRLSELGFPQYKGEQEGAPVEVAFSPDGKYAWVSNYAMYGKDFSNPGDDNCPPGHSFDPSFVYKIHTESLQVEAAVQVGSVPKYVAVTPDNRYVLVSNWCTGDLSVIDVSLDEEVCRLEMGLYPRGIAVDPQSQFAYVAIMGSSEIAVVDLNDFSVSYLEEVGRAPRHLCISPDGRYLYATLNHVNKVVKIDLLSFRVVDEVNAGLTPRSMTITDDGQWLYVVHYTSNQLSRIRTQDMKLWGREKTREKPIGVTYDARDKKVWVACYPGSIMVFEDTLSYPAAALPAAVSFNPITRIIQEARHYAFQKQLLQSVSISSRREAHSLAQVSLPNKPPKPAAPESNPPKGSFCIVLQSFQDPNNARRANQNYQKEGLETRILPAAGGWHRIAYGDYASASQARSALGKLKDAHALQGWILEAP